MARPASICGDGALFRTADTPELREHFGSGNTSSNRQTPHPVLRVVTMMNVRSHIIVDAAISLIAVVKFH
ncbi:mobile element protein [Vibrio ishigakensis]|uniref:Mobile element protein n=1 Tax=Vibrio ishigakensis TaxID=1481914 RepID=A0A0B8P9G0_9VIBR|nr:mobile element protein [Vibrio ishigakensis]